MSNRAPKLALQNSRYQCNVFFFQELAMDIHTHPTRNFECTRVRVCVYNNFAKGLERNLSLTVKSVDQ